jgi:hypothetical protein
MTIRSPCKESAVYLLIIRATRAARHLQRQWEDMDPRDQDIGQLKEAVRAIEAAVSTVLSDSGLAAAGGLDRLAPFSRVFRFALAEALVTGPRTSRTRGRS